MDKVISGATVAIAGLTFKENCNDIRNTRVVDIIAELRNYHLNVLIHDPLADPKEVKAESLKIIKKDNEIVIFERSSNSGTDKWDLDPMKFLRLNESIFTISIK